MECPGYKDDNKKLIECLRSKNMETLMNTHPNFYEWKHLEQSQEPVSAWSPRVDPEAKVPYMPNEPIDFMTQGEKGKRDHWGLGESTDIDISGGNTDSIWLCACLL